MEKRVGKRKIEPDVLVRAYLKRRDVILRPDMTLLPLSSPGWSLLAADLGNRLSLMTLYMKIKSQDIVEALYADKARTWTPAEPMPKRGKVPQPLNELMPYDQYNTKKSRRFRRPSHRNRHRNVALFGNPKRKTGLELAKGYPVSEQPEEAAVSSQTTDREEKEHSIESLQTIEQDIVGNALFTHESNENDTSRVEEEDTVRTDNIRNQSNQIGSGDGIRQVYSYNTLNEEIRRLRRKIQKMKKDRLRENQDLRAEIGELRRKISIHEATERVNRAQEGFVRVEIKTEEDDYFETEDVPILLDPVVKSEVQE